MIRKILLAIILATFTITLNAQGYWKLKSKTDDYTMENVYSIWHYSRDLYSRDIIDAIYFVKAKCLVVMRDYDEIDYTNTCRHTAIDIDNDGKIDNYTGPIYCRIIYSREYEELKLEAVGGGISYSGYTDDGKIDANGFYSSFSFYCEPVQLKKANYIIFRYYDKISEQMISQKLSLAGFTKAYNLIK